MPDGRADGKQLDKVMRFEIVDERTSTVSVSAAGSAIQYSGMPASA